MSTIHELICAGGVQEQTKASVARVSFWYIPGGCDYDRAQVIIGYFDCIELAERFAERNSSPPEMAHLEKIE